MITRTASSETTTASGWFATVASSRMGDTGADDRVCCGGTDQVRRVPSTPAESTRCPPGTIATPRTPPAWTPTVPSASSRSALQRTSRPSSSAVTNVAVSEADAIAAIVAESVGRSDGLVAPPASAPFALTVSSRHSRRPGSDPAVTAVRPSETKAALASDPACAATTARGAPSGRPQTRAALSCPPVTNVRPSPLTARQYTGPAWPPKRRSSVPLVASHRRAVSSPLAVTTRVPSGVKAAMNTPAACPRSTTVPGGGSAAMAIAGMPSNALANALCNHAGWGIRSCMAEKYSPRGTRLSRPADRRGAGLTRQLLPFRFAPLFHFATAGIGSSEIVVCRPSRCLSMNCFVRRTISGFLKPPWPPSGIVRTRHSTPTFAQASSSLVDWL